MTSASLPDDWPHREASDQISAGGLVWHVQRLGKGPALLLIHGTAASTHSFKDLATELSDSFEIVMVDLPGHGFSGALDAPTLPRVATALAALLDRMDVKPAIAAGHSAGAAIALRMAIDGFIDPRVIIGLAPALQPYGGAADGLASGLARLAFLNPVTPRLFSMRASSERVARLISKTGSHLDEAGIDAYVRLMKRSEHIAGALRLMAHWKLRPLQQDLGKVTAPTLFIVGDKDRATPPREVDAAARRLPACTVEHLAGLGHLAHEEDPGAVARLVRRAASDAGVLADPHSNGPRLAGEG